MTEADWADKIADSLVSDCEDSNGNWRTYASVSDISAALRKAKADGMRKAADLADDLSIHELGWGEVANYIDDLRRRIAEIEKGTE